MVSLGFLGVLFWHLNIGEFGVHLSNAPLGYLIPWAIFSVFVLNFLWGVRIYMFYRPFGKGTFWRILGAGFKLQVIGTVMPGQLGDLGLMYILKDVYQQKQSAAVLLVDKTVSLLIVSLFSAIGIGIIYSWLYGSIILICLIAVGGVTTVWMIKR